jgi:hypothetical protein
MKQIYILIIAAFTFTFFACNKETPTTQTEVIQTLLANKNWYLDYSISDGANRSYVGQATYFVTYLTNGTTKDSDGLEGTYTIEIVNNQSQIHVQVKTSNGNPLEVIYNIVSVGDNRLVLSKQEGTGGPTQLYFSYK